MTDEHRPNTEAQPRAEHPDNHEINDWFLFGPKNGHIEELVRELTLTHGLRLSEVEGLIVAALEERRRSLPDAAVQP
jgi:hypothetical protein